MRLNLKNLAFSYPIIKSGSHLHSSPTVLIDGTSLMYKSYFAMPSLQSIHDSQPKEIGAAAGFCSMLINILLPMPDQSNSTVLVMFDSKEQTFRHDLFAGYKTNREAPPDDLYPQFDLVFKSCAAFGWPVLKAPGFEADDIIASLSRQCISTNCFMMCPTKKQMFGPSDVFDKFGVHPSQMIDYQSLVGDAVDNIKGIPGIGPKTAASLLAQFQSLDSIIEKSDQISNTRIRKLVEEHKASALLARSLVTLQDVPYTRFEEPDIPDQGALETLLTTPTQFNARRASEFLKENGMLKVERAMRSKIKKQDM